MSATMALVALMLIFAGCGKKEKEYTVSAPGGKMTVKGGDQGKGSMEIVTKEGKVAVATGQQGAITEAQLGAPVYPGAKVHASVRMDGSTAGKESMEMYTLVSTDNFEKVAAFYKANLKNVKSTFVQGSGDQGMASFSIGENNAMTINIVPGSDKGTTTIQVARKIR